MDEKRGRFIVLEGIDGSGKSDQLIEIARHIKRVDKYRGVFITSEPTRDTTKILDKLRAEKDGPATALKYTVPLIDGRKNHLDEEITPLLISANDVLCSRFTVSTLVYQVVQGADQNDLIRMHLERGITPADITYCLDVSVEEGAARRVRRGEPRERFENPEFQRRAREKYIELIDRVHECPTSPLARLVGKIKYIDGMGPKEEVTQRIIGADGLLKV